MKKTKQVLMIGVILPFFLASCGGKKKTEPKPTPSGEPTGQTSSPAKEYFTLWNECDALSTLKNYVEDVTNENSKNFIPVKDRIATFDMDGTFVGELYPTYFEYNLLEYRALEDETYDAPLEVKEVAQEIRDFVRDGVPLPSHFDMRHAYAAAKAYAGMSLKEFDEYVKNYAKTPANGFKNMTYAESFYKPMLDVFEYLEDNDFTYYVVSGSDRFICRSLVESIGIEPNRVIGMDVVLKSSNQGYAEGVEYTMGKDEDIIRTDELIIKNLKTNKVKQIVQEIGKVPVLSFGNSSGDSAMHNFCMGNKQYKSEAFMLVADDNVRDHADLNEGAKRQANWEKAGYNIISMKNDFKTIYGEGVEKVDFTYGETKEEEITFNEFHEIAVNLPEHGYTKAIMDVKKDAFETAKDNSVPPTIELAKDLVITADYDSGEASWTLNDDDPTDLIFVSCLETNASQITQDDGTDVFNEKFYQNREVHYYNDGETLRYRYKANGVMTIPGYEYALTLEGVKIFDNKGQIIFSDVVNTMEIDNTIGTTVEIINIQYQ